MAKNGKCEGCMMLGGDWRWCRDSGDCTLFEDWALQEMTKEIERLEEKVQELAEKNRLLREKKSSNPKQNLKVCNH